MSKKNLQEFKNMSEQELVTAHKEAVRELFFMKNQAKLSKEVKDLHLFKAKRKQIARMLTLIGEKSREQVCQN